MSECMQPEMATDKSGRYNLHAVQVPQQPEFPISEKELIEKLKVSRSLILKLRNGDKIPFIRLGTRILYQPSKVLSALEVTPNKPGA